jgi:hypothetical protein
MLDEARPLIERALRNRESTDKDPTRLGEVNFAMARLLAAEGREPAQARVLAERARSEYTRAPQSATTNRILAQILAFLDRCDSDSDDGDGAAA